MLKSYYKFHSFRVRNVLVSFLYLVIWYDFAVWSIPFLILLSGDIETNPSPKPIAGQNFSICHWNLNSISAHNFTKIFLLSAYVLVHNFDIICLSETYLHSEISTDDKNLEIPGYYLLRADHPPSDKTGGVCIFYRTNLPLRILNISYLSECVTFEISIGKKICRFIHLYRSPSQTQDEFQTFKSEDWCSIDITSFEGSELDFLTSQFVLSQIVKETTHILDNSRSCIDLTFTSQTNMVIDSGVHASLHANCHHQIIYAKFDLNIIYPPPYERTVWHFKHANSDHIKRAIGIFDWESALNYIDANDQVSVFNSTILNIISNFIPSETITCDDRDHPWMNSFIKNLIRAKDNFYKKFVRKSNDMYHHYAFKNFQNHLNQSIQMAKQNSVNKIAQRLGDANTSSNCYWSLLKTLLNGKKFLVFPLYFMLTNILLTFKKKLRFSIHFSLTNVLRFQTESSCLPNYHCGQMAHYLLVTLEIRTSFE